MKKLTYVKTADIELTVDLQNGYTIVASGLFDYEKQEFHVTLYLKENSVSLFDLMEDFNDIVFETNQYYVKSAILKHIATLLSEGQFDSYIDRYEYMLKCFDAGSELFEKERLGEK